MNYDKDAEIVALISRLTHEIELAERHSLGLTVQLLRIATLDLKMMVFAITDDEVRALVDAIQDVVSLDRGPVSRSS
jgi:hypothetical protein